jgi:hypothetical protein
VRVFSGAQYAAAAKNANGVNDSNSAAETTLVERLRGRAATGETPRVVIAPRPRRIVEKNMINNAQRSGIQSQR